ncbi:hypothetical protein CXB51_020902 [Gossypium anomalum]|uniref:Uncharacterized protein n=1 Tax=Gossypium anomalum TaxID=47600 RepID=A0A8J5ZG34_9ROSI|nr:hypothetical protein CXB51_020902 [Gossypium anomalum]
MLTLNPGTTFLQSPNSVRPKISFHFNIFPPFSTVKFALRSHYASPKASFSMLKAKRREEDISSQPFDIEMDDEYDDDNEGYEARSGFRGREEEKNYDKDPEFAEILGSCLDDPEKARSKMEDRLRKKRNKILHTKTGSGTPMKVTFNNIACPGDGICGSFVLFINSLFVNTGRFDFSNSYIWFEFYNTPLEKDISLICDTIRSWHIIGRLGGCNSMNMQLSQSPLEKRPSYDAIQGANVNPTTFYNIGDLEVQDNLARIWVDIGTTEPLILDVLINALTQISSDYIGIKQLVFGGSELENWKESLTTEDAGYTSLELSIQPFSTPRKWTKIRRLDDARISSKVVLTKS